MAVLALVLALAGGCAGMRAAKREAPPSGGPPADSSRQAGSRKGTAASKPAGTIVALPAGHSGRHLKRIEKPFASARDSAGWGEAVVERTPEGFRWRAADSLAPEFDLPAAALWRSPDGAVVVDSIELWRLRARDTLFAEPARLRLAALHAADGDTAAADSLLAAPPLPSSIWAWEALRRRVTLARAGGRTTRADSLLTLAGTAGWPEGDVAALRIESARAALAVADTARALSRAWACIRQFPGLPAGAAALRLIDTLGFARGDSLGLSETRLAAEVEALRGAPAAGAARLLAVLPRAGAAERASLLLRVGELERRARRWRDALAHLRAGERATRDTTLLARLRLESARAALGAGDGAAAEAHFKQVAAMPVSLALREAAAWERAREFQDAGRFASAERAFLATAVLGGRRAPEARMLAGLMAFAEGHVDSALARWAGSDLEPARFWRGVALRARGDRRGDSLLAVVAATPGYGFYPAAARDTLGRRGLPDGTSPARGDADADPVSRRILALGRIGLVDEALFLAGRRGAQDERLPGAPASPPSGDAITAAEVAMRAGRPWRAVGFAQRALRAPGTLPDSVQWSFQPWAYPPAFDSLVAAASDSLRLEVALVYATMRQESLFDPQARSTSNALGLMQLLLPAAQDAARWAREPRPTGETPLLDPATNVKWGTRYLARLIDRFEGRVSVALSAYNAGPSTVPPFWRDLIARGGEALFCEVASNADAQLYAKRILGYRQAYRELRPVVGR